MNTLITQIFKTRKGSAGDETTSTLTNMLLFLGFAVVAAGILYTFISTGGMPQFAVFQDFTGGMAP